MNTDAPKTTFAGGRNPFSAIMATMPTEPPKRGAKTIKPAKTMTTTKTKATAKASTKPARPAATPLAKPSPKNPTKGKNSVPNVELLTVTRDPLPGRRACSSKYDELFASLKPGDSIKCQPEHVLSIRSSLYKWCKHRGLKFKIRSVMHYPTDKLGRVFLLDRVAK